MEKTVKIVLTCPECGNKNWHLPEPDKGFSFKCTECGTESYPEDMLSVTEENE